MGVETAGGVFTRIITKNTTIPLRRAQVFSTAVDNQPYVNVHVLQGEREMASDNRSLANFQLTGIPPAPRGKPQIEVSFDIDSNGIVSVAAKNLQTGQAQTVVVTPTSGLNEAQIAEIALEAEKYREEDEKKRGLADLLNGAGTLIYSTEHALEEFGSKVDPAAKEDVRVQIKAVKALIDGNNIDGLKEAVASLEQAAQRLFESLGS